MSIIKFDIDVDGMMAKVRKIATEEMQSRKYDVNCPHCDSKVVIPAGKSACPMCQEIIDLTLDIEFNG